MASSINKVMLIGNLRSDPEIRTAGDQVLGGFYLVTRDSWVDKDGARKEKIEQHRVAITDTAIAKRIGDTGRKGALAYVDGSLQTKELTDQRGEKRFVTEVVAGFRNKVSILAPEGAEGHINKVILIGNMGKDPAVRNAGKATFCDFSMATTENWKDKTSGEWTEKTEWHKVSIVATILAEKVGRDGGKGKRVYVEGTLETRRWTDQQGEAKSSTEIVVGFMGQVQILEKKGDGTSSGARSGGGASSSANHSRAPVPAGGDLDDEVPF